MALPDRWITDTRVSTRYPVYTRANAGEVLPEPASPLGWTLVFAPGVNEGWRDCQIRVGTCDPDEVTADEVTGLFGGRLYINASLARLFGVRGPGLSAEMVDQAYFGEHPDVPPYVPEPWHESAAATERLAAWMGSVLMAPDLDVLLDDRAEAERVRAERPDLSSATDAELVERARSLVPLVRRLFDRHLEMTAGTSIGTGVLAQVAAAVGDPTLPLTLITSVGDVDSALPSHEMWALSRLDRSSPEYRSGFSSFVERHGSRGPNEWDIHSETWETEPALAEALIEVMRSAPDDADPARRDAVNTAAREEAAARVHEVLADQPELLATFETGLRSAHLYLAGRERAKTTIISVVHEIRMAVRELGQRYDYPLDVITMLLADELEAFVSAPDEYRARLSVRHGQHAELRELDPPFIVDGSVPPLSSWSRVADRAAAVAARSGEVLAGVPGSPGTATGVARVILDPADPFALGPGEILVAPITDPAWTPLFVPAAAVVVDVGAPVSHAVIVSRELGIPCVVSVHDATRRIVDGATVTVDGAAGTVIIH